MEGLSCRLCRFAGSDVRLSCGCCLHAKCVPMQLIVAPVADGSSSKYPSARLPNSFMCPICNSAPVSSIEMFAMEISLLDRAVDARKKANLDKQMKNAVLAPGLGGGEDCAFDEIQAESSYLLLSHSGASGAQGFSSNSDCQRTGRWTDEEIEFVDFLLQAFDRGLLPMASGIRLNDFLCSMLLCKASRLTKKMKNARLSIRSYEINAKPHAPVFDCELLTTLQEKFLQSIQDEWTRLELRFNMEKAWRTNLSNLCVQVGSSMLDATAWLASLEQMERRATMAEDNIRKARRRRMGLALKTDVGAQAGVFFSGVPVQVKRPERERADSATVPRAEKRERCESTSHSVSSASESNSSENHTNNHISNMLDIGSEQGNADTTEDFAVIFNDLIGGMPTDIDADRFTMRNDGGAFVDEVMAYVERKQLPFEHVDVWVPSYTPQSQGGPDHLRLFHAGHATRTNLDPSLFFQLKEYGDYSTKFSFAPAIGLPGRVYKSGTPTWERRIDEADPKIFERAGGAKVYGVKTGVGVPISSGFIGRLVVAMYSMTDLEADSELLKQMSVDLSTFCPKPKWKLVVDMGSEPVVAGMDPPAPSTGVAHYRHESGGVLPSPGLGRASVAMHPTSTPKEISVVNVPTLKQAPVESMVRSNSMASTHSAMTVTVDNSQHSEEIIVATLLGECMPGPTEPAGQLPAFMSLRLLLLRSPEKRSAEDNSVLEVIMKSYRGFSQDQTRSKKEIADLLARDWRFLQMAASEPPEVKKPAANPNFSKSKPHQCHVMGAPSVSTYSASGAPVLMPSTLGNPKVAQAALQSKSSPLEEDHVAKKRRVSSSDEPFLDSMRSQSVNIVDESS